MFDSFSNRAGSSQAGRFMESYDPSTNIVDRGASTSSFGDIASYDVCACCARFHGPSSGGEGGEGVIVNSDDRGSYGTNGKPSLLPGDAGTQITRTNSLWGGVIGQAATVTYSFRLSAASMPTDTQGFTQFSAQQIIAAELAFASWAEVANITFVRVNDAGSQYSNNATIVLGNYSSGQSG